MIPNPNHTASNRRSYNLLLLCVAGLGGLLYGVDVGIIGGALPYLEATSRLSAGQLSVIVAAVLLGSVISTIFAGVLSDGFGRKPMMVVSGLVFVISIPLIALSHGYTVLLVGRLLQGISGGFIGVVVPLYLAECLVSQSRGKGTGIFQWLLTFGIVIAALIGMYYSYRVQAVAATGNADALFAVQNNAWRRIFWMSLPPGLLFAFGSLFVTESPRWLYRRGRTQEALTSLLRSRTPEAAALELAEMGAVRTQPDVSHKGAGSLLRRKYVVPFLLACVILACNTATGINSIIGYNTSILLQSGLTDLGAHWGYVLFTSVNFLMTIVGITLVDRKGRRFLLTLGTGGVMLSLIACALLFHQVERNDLECGPAVQGLVQDNETLSLKFNQEEAGKLLTASGYSDDRALAAHASFAIIYSYAGFTSETTYMRSDDPSAAAIRITRAASIPENSVKAFFQNPFADFDQAKTAPLKIERARMGRIPSPGHGYIVALALFIFVAFYAAGPGVCVWLALSELMPTRIRSVGMSVALVLNQFVSTTLAVLFLPVVSKYGYTWIFLLFAGFTVLYFLAIIFFLPETKGKTLEEVEQSFENRRPRVSIPR
ncbi:MFS transporter [Granulicella sp. L60]|uniref:MFS transporter n=1 Tax=Granulicella sp. L60 TaxID=1641866 RepID=UPI00131D3192|nr:MFS transporter [Granulicella sp. L60]